MAPSSASQFRHRQSISNIPLADSLSRGQSFFAGFKVSSPRPEQTFVSQAPEEILEESPPPDETPPMSPRRSLKRALSSQMSRVNSIFRGQSYDSPPQSPTAGVSTPPATHEMSMSSDDIAGPRFQTTPPVEPVGDRTAGDYAVYSNITVYFFYLDTKFLD